jgi:hypothetical protein
MSNCQVNNWQLPCQLNNWQLPCRLNNWQLPCRLNNRKHQLNRRHPVDATTAKPIGRRLRPSSGPGWKAILAEIILGIMAAKGWQPGQGWAI